jgi:hypothetical protein
MKTQEKKERREEMESVRIEQLGSGRRGVKEIEMRIEKERYAEIQDRDK